MSIHNVPGSGKSSSGADGQQKMLDYIQQMLKELEDAQGGQDEEARRAVAVLQQKTEELACAQEASAQSKGPPTSPQPVSDIEIASHLDRLEEQLGELEGRLADTDEHTQNIVGNSTALWLSESDEGQEKEKLGRKE